MHSRRSHVNPCSIYMSLCMELKNNRCCLDVCMRSWSLFVEVITGIQGFWRRMVYISQCLRRSKREHLEMKHAGYKDAEVLWITNITSINEVNRLHSTCMQTKSMWNVHSISYSYKLHTALEQRKPIIRYICTVLHRLHFNAILIWTIIHAYFAWSNSCQSPSAIEPSIKFLRVL